MPPATQRHAVSVSVRVRPCLRDGGAPDDGGEGTGVPSPLRFPTVEGADQAAAYDTLAGELVGQFVRGGLQCTLCAYGQTGSGKTHTLFGPPGALTEAALEQTASGAPAQWGVFPRAMLDLLAAPELVGATFRASAVEVYMDQAYDLLNGRKPLRVGAVRGSGRGIIVESDIGKDPVYSGAAVIVGGLHPSGCSCRKCFAAQTAEANKREKERAAAANAAVSAAKKPGVPRLSAALKKAAGGRRPPGGDEQFGTEGETTWPLQEPADVAKLARLVEAERVAHGHALNARSSRSHCLIRVQCTHLDGDGRSQNRLFLFVDLAGSERITKSGATGARQKEASNINQSLTTLGRVVKELTGRKPAPFVSYRDSVLTMLLRDSFAGPSCTGFVICVASEKEHADETLCSLRFGEQLSGVQTSSVAAQAVDVGAQRAQLASELEAARARLAAFAAAGQAGGISADAPPTEQASLRGNMATLARREVEVRVLKAQLAEAKAKGAGVGDAASKLARAEASCQSVRDLVERQKTIPGLFQAPSAAHAKAEAHVASLASRLAALGPA